MSTNPTLADEASRLSPRSLALRAAKGLRANLGVLFSWRPGRRDAAEIILLVSALPIYYLVRGITQTQVDEAVQRGINLISIERSLGVFWEVEMQSWILPYDWLVKVLNNFYLFGHLPVIGVLAVWLYFWHRPQYLFMRNAFLISGAIALIFYVNFPTAPPRLLPESLGFGFVDTVVNQYQESRPLTPSWFVNEYAAFPSMHIGWNLLVGLAVWLATKNIFIRAFALLMPMAMMADIVLTANHYIIDGIAALPVITAAIAIAAGARWLVMRKLSPENDAVREKGWVGWVYWLVGIPPGARATNSLVPTPKAA
ncbi:MAG: phosphatase PAP2 family protein [Chloroflexi bacterium]|nr:phosphatase PAP2 family protein [Chloroflexota bacterium]